MAMCDVGDFRGLIVDLEKDILLAKSIHRVDNRALEEVGEAKLWPASELVSRFQCSKARKFLQSNGLGDHNDPAIVEQIQAKYPRRKEAVTPLTAAELEALQKGICGEVLCTKLGQLNHDVAPGLGGLRNEHLHTLIMNEKREKTPSAAGAVDNPCNYANAAVSIELPQYFYVAWLATRLVLVNKTDPADLPLGMETFTRPINVGYAKRRLITRAYFYNDLQAVYNGTLGPVQNGCGISGGISIKVFGVSA